MHRPRWITGLMFLVHTGLLIMGAYLIMNAGIRTIALAVWVAAWFAFDGVKIWIERLADA